jgi:hypothetical protein
MNIERAAALYEKRKNAVEAVQRGEPVSLVARTHHVPWRTIFGWMARYRREVGLPCRRDGAPEDRAKPAVSSCSGSIMPSPLATPGSITRVLPLAPCH